MHLAHARYDVIMDDGFACHAYSRPSTAAVLDFAEIRLADDWGDPGPLVDARLWRVLWVSQGRASDVGYRRPHLLICGAQVRARSKHRRFLRWHVPDDDPPPHDDPECVTPP